MGLKPGPEQQSDHSKRESDGQIYPRILQGFEDMRSPVRGGGNAPVEVACLQRGITLWKLSSGCTFVNEISITESILSPYASVAHNRLNGGQDVCAYPSIGSVSKTASGRGHAMSFANEFEKL